MTEMLKIPSFIPPVVALVVAGAWLANQRHAISSFENDSIVLEKHIAAARSASAADPERAKPVSPAKAAKAKEPLDWKNIAAQFAEMQQSGGMGDMRTIIRLQQRLQTMTQQEIVAALDEIASLGLAEDCRSLLEQMLIGPLVEKDPEFAISHLIDRLQDPGSMIGWHLSDAMREWAKKDPAKATAWFDQQIAAGKFDSKSLDGKSRSRNQFEGALVNILLASDPDAAARRLGAMAEDQRAEVLGQGSFQQLKEENQLAFATLVRGQLPEEDQAKTLGQKAASLVQLDGYSKVTEFLDRIKATPAERTACVQQAASSKLFSISLQKTITRENLDAMREWVTAQAPESTSTVTGKALANASYNHNVRKMEFSEAADLASEYDAAVGNGAVLTSFLDSWQAVQNKGEIRVLAEKITDVKRREEILEKLK